MARRSKQEWFALFEAHEKSGISAAEFCREHQLCAKYFSLRKQQLGWALQQSRTFLPIVITPDTEGGKDSLELRWGEMGLSIPSTLSPLWVSQLMKALQ